MFWATTKCNIGRWITQHEYRHKWQWHKIGPSLLWNKNGDLSFFFRNNAWKRTFRESFTKIHHNFYFSGITLTQLQNPPFWTIDNVLRTKVQSRLKYKLSKVNYSPTPWGLVSHRSTCKSPHMPHISPAWGGGGGWGFPVTGALPYQLNLGSCLIIFFSHTTIFGKSTIVLVSVSVVNWNLDETKPTSCLYVNCLPVISPVSVVKNWCRSFVTYLLLCNFRFSNDNTWSSWMSLTGNRKQKNMSNFWPKKTALGTGRLRNLSRGRLQESSWNSI